MRRLPLVLLALLYINAYAQHPERYFRFIEPSKEVVNTTITSTVSIDRMANDTVWAYANEQEFSNFQQLGYKVELLTPPSLLETKALDMATGIGEMAGWNRYPTYSAYREMMKRFEADYPAICQLDSIGTTVEGRQLYVVKISGNVTSDEAEPEFFYTSTMHGDETTGYVLMLRLIDSLLSQYNTNPRITAIVNSMAIYINPNANPDATYRSGNNTVSGARRYNANDVDLNRNFPDPRRGDHPDGNSWQPETQSMMNFASQRRFTASANIHGGDELVNYPWDTWKSSQRQHADRNWFYAVSRAYADTAQKYGHSNYFKGQDNGVTNGGDWYVIAGGRQDYMNYWHHCREITLEISNSKLLSSDKLPAYWDYNKEALLSYMETCGKGIRGIVKDEDNNFVRAKVHIASHDGDSSEVYSNAVNGFYSRPIEAGTWSVTYSALGYEPQEYTLTVSDLSATVTQDIILTRQKSFEVVFEVKHNGNPLENATVTLNGTSLQTNSEGKAAFGSVPRGRNYPYSVSANGYVTVDGQVDVEESCTVAVSILPVGVETPAENSTLSVFPNPFSKIVNISLYLDKPDMVEVALYTLNGSQILKMPKTAYRSGEVRITLPIPTANALLTAGSCVVRVSTSSKNYSRIIQHLP